MAPVPLPAAEEGRFSVAYTFPGIISAAEMLIALIPAGHGFSENANFTSRPMGFWLLTTARKKSSPDARHATRNAMM